MASMAIGAATRLARSIDSAYVAPHSHSQLVFLSRFPNVISTNYAINGANYCGMVSRSARSIKIRAMSSSPLGLPSEDSVKKTVGENPVVVYSKSWCSYSSEVKYLLKSVGVEPLVIELDQLGSQGSEIQKILEKLTGQYTVPNVFIGGKHIGGCTDTVNLHEEGKLEPLLSEAGAAKSTRS